MKRYTHLLFDLDGTLFDFQAAERFAFQKTCETLGIPYTKEVMDAYSRINESYWKLFELGKVSQQELAVRRFSDLYDYLGMTGNAVEANLLYRRFLGQGNKMYPDTIPVCSDLAKHYHLCLITNGLADVQYSRLNGSPLMNYASEVFISDEIGKQKPQKDYFDYVYEKLNVVPSQVLIIGDSLTSDIRGAANAKTDSCWYNPDHKKNPFSDLHPTYEISSLPDLLSLLG